MQCLYPEDGKTQQPILSYISGTATPDLQPSIGSVVTLLTVVYTMAKYFQVMTVGSTVLECYFTFLYELQPFEII